MKISKNGLNRDKGPKVLVNNKALLPNHISWKEEDGCLCLKIPGKDRNSEYMFTVEIASSELALLVKEVLCKSSENPTNQAIAEGLQAFLGKILSKPECTCL